MSAPLSPRQLRKIMPNLSASKAELYFPPLVAAMEGADITTPARAAAFLAQLAHESGELRYMEEIADGSAYEDRVDLGNTQPGDGKRYKGRGPIQLTGKSNYAAASRALGLNLVENPEIAATPEVAFRVAAWFWTSRSLNALADAGDFRRITHRINGGYNGLPERVVYWYRALVILGADAPI